MRLLSNRYLWPLIHYHKFLAKCIKKLKRNGVDVKQSVSPVAVFLREEVCAISDHLAAVSLFGSEEWMACLQYFSGWIVMTNEAEHKYRKFVSEIPLRSIQEPGDVNSPLLRSQIDENFLRTMIAQREQMRDTVNPMIKKHQSPNADDRAEAPSKDSSHGPPPMYPRGSVGQPGSIPKQINGVRRPRYYSWWNGTNWEHAQPPPGVFADSSSISVQSALSAESFAHPPTVPHHYDYGMYQMHPYQYAVPPPPPGFVSSDHSHSSSGFDSYGNVYDWTGGMDPHAMYGYVPRPPMDGYYQPHSPGYFSPHVANVSVDEEPPQSPEHTATSESENAASPAMVKAHTTQASPYWAHLDQATIMMGLATPAKVTPSTPRRKNDGGEEPTYAVPAQGPLIRQHYYSFAPVRTICL